MLTLPADLTPAQQRAIDALVHTALTGEKVEWRFGHHYMNREWRDGNTGTGDAYEPCYRPGKWREERLLSGNGWYPIPSYLSGDDCWRLVEEMVKPEVNRLEVRCSESGERSVALLTGWLEDANIEAEGIGPTPQAAVVAAYMDKEKILLPEVKT